jgi:hypothetical protein
MNSDELKKLEETKEDILRKIAEKINIDPNKGDIFRAAHSSHSSSSKHSSSTGPH